MVTTRRGKSTAVTPASPRKVLVSYRVHRLAASRVTAKKADKADVGNGSYATSANGAQHQQTGKKRGADKTGDSVPAEVPKRQKKTSNSKVEPAKPPLEEKAAVPEADTIAAAAALDPLAGPETAVSAEDLDSAPADVAEEEAPKPDVSHTSEMPVSEAVKVIGGTQAGSAPVSEVPTAGKALDSVPVGPDPAAAAPAPAMADDDMPQDGDYFLDATLADSKQGNEESKPVGSATAPLGTNDTAKTGFLAPSVSAAETDTETGLAADVGAAAPADVPPGVHADPDAVGHTAHVPGSTDTMHEAISTAPTTVGAHDSLFGAAAAQDSADMPAVYGGDNA